MVKRFGDIVSYEGKSYTIICPVNQNPLINAEENSNAYLAYINEDRKLVGGISCPTTGHIDEVTLPKAPLMVYLIYV